MGAAAKINAGLRGSGGKEQVEVAKLRGGRAVKRSEATATTGVAGGGFSSSGSI